MNTDAYPEMGYNYITESPEAAKPLRFGKVGLAALAIEEVKDLECHADEALRLYAVAQLTQEEPPTLASLCQDPYYMALYNLWRQCGVELLSRLY